MSTKYTKVRTGCATCKARKVKCDEARPTCKRCADAGRLCDGYAHLEVAIRSRQRRLIPKYEAALIGSRSDTWSDAAFLSNTVNVDERRWLQYFVLQAGPALADVTHEAFWTKTMPQLAATEPAIRYALLAVGSSYARHAAKLSGAREDEVSNRSYGFKQYNLAINSLRKYLADHPTSLQVPLICCLLFICLECIYNNRPLVLNHLHGGLKMLESSRHQFKESKLMPGNLGSLECIYYRLNAETVLCGQRTSPLTTSLEVASDYTMSPAFVDIVEAKHSLDVIMSMSLNFIRCVKTGYFSEGAKIDLARATKARLQAQFVMWKSAMDKFETGPLPQAVIRDRTIIRTRIRYCAGYIYLAKCLESGECSYDSLKLQFSTIVRLATFLLRPTDKDRDSELSLLLTSATAYNPCPMTFSLNASLITSLTLVATKCRDPVIRRRGLALLESIPGRENVWDAQIQARIARRVIELEESAMLISQGSSWATMEKTPSMKMRASDNAVLNIVPDEKCRIVMADLRASLEDPKEKFCVSFIASGQYPGRGSAWEEWLPV